MTNTTTPSVQLIRDAVAQAIKTGRSFHDYWYYTMEHPQRMLFQGFQEFEKRADWAYRHELEPPHHLHERSL